MDSERTAKLVFENGERITVKASMETGTAVNGKIVESIRSVTVHGKLYWMVDKLRAIGVRTIGYPEPTGTVCIRRVCNCADKHIN